MKGEINLSRTTTTSNIYTNRPHQIENSDLFGTKLKAELIKNLLVNNSEYFNQNNMIALYGEWGTGKTSVMEYIKNNCEQNYSAVFFEAWQYEKDSNLSLSLFELIVGHVEKRNSTTRLRGSTG